MVRLYFAEGLEHSPAGAELKKRAATAQVRWEVLPKERLSALAAGGVHQGVVAEVKAFSYASLEEIIAAADKSGNPGLVVALDGVQDPHNLGAIIRSAHALGAHGVVLPKDRAAQVTGVVAKSSAGALEHSRIARVVNLSRALETLKEAGYWVAAFSADGDTALWDAKLDGKVVLVVGAEGDGVREGVLNHCDFRVKIPMAGKVDSLNASVAAGLALYEIVRQRALAQKPKLR